MLERILIEDTVRALRPDFAVLLMTAEGLVNGPSSGDTVTTGDLAESAGPHVEAWREAYRGFGVNPKRARPSVDALLRRAELPGINRVVDAYNAISVRYGLPIGGEDLDAYDGPARLVRADGSEPFATVKNGEPVVEHPEPGEVVWRDDAGVTCRRWNWRQCTRTHITERTKNALFVMERLDPYPLERLTAAGADLAALLREITPSVLIETRLVEP
ncbi:phenylalanine--tRNA ligase beta subunit-related protein [Actinomadura sp. DC4]|uniref:B3/B4 domain-containing protein n=1 Tax=Actinomadura sp. DC4 TaxID=3055069 RepID=UPI0025B05FB2|nr:phenylalanine--tRNA ligase beta subunit-related protein [Actinomadura sp. DC4]MDN3352820.1 phenylalanine--tRNA ligase beta subunit-related protein [Actinomadura sp. DC4]